MLLVAVEESDELDSMAGLCGGREFDVVPYLFVGQPAIHGYLKGF